MRDHPLAPVLPSFLHRISERRNHPGARGSGADYRIAGDGNDTLDGRSGLGDGGYLFGEAGNDSCIVDTPFDLVFEAPGEGFDTVIADIVGAGRHLYAGIEALVLPGPTPFGVGNDLANALTGNASGNVLLGGAGDDTIDGKAGNDVLFGEAGADLLVFVHGADRIQLPGPGFGSFAQVQAALSEVSGTSAINLGSGDFIVIDGVAAATWTAGDFLLA